MKDFEYSYSVIQRDFIGDEETTRDTRIIKCSSLDDFKEKMQQIATRSYENGTDQWKLEAPQIWGSLFERPLDSTKDIEIKHYTEFCDTEPLLIWKEEVCDFSRWNKLKSAGHL